MHTEELFLDVFIILNAKWDRDMSSNFVFSIYRHLFNGTNCDHVTNPNPTDLKHEIRIPDGSGFQLAPSHPQ